jgi:alkylglycerol monooxygenase
MLHNHPLHAFGLAFILMSVFVAMEFMLSRIKKKQLFHFHEFFANIACGLLERATFLVFATAYYFVLEQVYVYRILTIPNSIVSHILLFLLVDLLWYFYHRSGHRINILWAAHITHHQSKDYNLSLSFRVSIFQLIIRTFFWSLLPFLGFDPAYTFVMIGINAAYQFFIHTNLVNKMGVLEKILVTPSHHRVHHGSNTAYLDKNYGGIFILWDKLFGTFAEENETVNYGITKDINSYNPFTAWLHYYQDLFKATTRKKSWKEKINFLFAPPETMSDYYQSNTNQNPPTNYLVSLHSSLKTHLFLQLAWLMFGLWVLYTYFDSSLIAFYSILCIPLYAVSLFSLHQLITFHQSNTLETIRISLSVLFIIATKVYCFPDLSLHFPIGFFLLSQLFFLFFIFNKKSQ